MPHFFRPAPSPRVRMILHAGQKHNLAVSFFFIACHRLAEIGFCFIASVGHVLVLSAFAGWSRQKISNTQRRSPYWTRASAKTTTSSTTSICVCSQQKNRPTIPQVDCIPHSGVSHVCESSVVVGIVAYPLRCAERAEQHSSILEARCTCLLSLFLGMVVAHEQVATGETVPSCISPQQPKSKVEQAQRFVVLWLIIFRSKFSPQEGFCVGLCFFKAAGVQPHP